MFVDGKAIPTYVGDVEAYTDTLLSTHIGCSSGSEYHMGFLLSEVPTVWYTGERIGSGTGALDRREA